MRILVLGYLVRGPLGGIAWHHLQYARGLCDLGHEVYFLEDSGDYAACYDPRTNETGADPAYGLHFAAQALERVGLGDRWAYFDAQEAKWHGPCAGRALELCSTAEVLLNVSGANPLRDWHLAVPRRVLIDTDPAFTQIRHLSDPAAAARAALHTDFFSFGENIGKGASVPDDGLPWRPTRQPVVLDLWRVTPGPVDAAFTTVMQWDSYRAREHAGRRYGMKSDSFGAYLDLPRRTSAKLAVAAGAPRAVRDELVRHGWIAENPLEVASDPSAYQAYLRRSKAEFTLVKHGYAVTASGWFSERSAAYLASGRPVVTQSTGFDAWLPTGRGVLAFDTPEEAIDALGAVERDYAAHCSAARTLVEEFFDSRRVLPGLLEALA